mmetsp:Transcript_152432/g.280520  ORF Transcript_152432/g.280520 Transcript_152432/m.280520 type:complete len:226 (-) Transcript_152432:405-1082(-)
MDEVLSKSTSCSSSALIVNLAGHAAQPLDVPFDSRLTHPQTIPSYLGEQEEDVAVELLTVAERPPSDLAIPIRQPDSAVSIKGMSQERQVANEVECILVVLVKLELKICLDILKIHQCHCEVQGHITVVNLVSVEDVGKCDADQPMVVPVGEMIKDPQLRDNFVEVISQQCTLIGVCVLHEERIIIHRHRPCHRPSRLRGASRCDRAAIAGTLLTGCRGVAPIHS